jgi:hypothetical protein
MGLRWGGGEGGGSGGRAVAPEAAQGTYDRSVYLNFPNNLLSLTGIYFFLFKLLNCLKYVTKTLNPFCLITPLLLTLLTF